MLKPFTDRERSAVSRDREAFLLGMRYAARLAVQSKHRFGQSVSDEIETARLEIDAVAKSAR